MMIVKLIVLVALAASPAFCSAGIKGYSQQREETKGGRLLAPVEQQRLEAPTKSYEQPKQELLAEHREEQHRELLPEQQKEEFHQQREELKHEEVKGLRYEARPQVREEQRELSQPIKGGLKREEPILQVAQKEERFEQQQREYDAPQQVVEIRREQQYEQRRYEEPATFVQPAQPLEETRDYSGQQKVEYASKGGIAAPVAPIGEAEPYAFNYQVEGSTRTESGDTKGVVRGQYTIQGADGMSRVVDYVADHNGFHATVNTNEFGTEAKSPAGVALRTSQPAAEDITLRLEGKTRESVAASLPVAPLAVKAPPVPPKPDNWQVKGQQLLVQTPQLPPLPAVQQTQLAYEDVKGARKIEEIKTVAPIKGQRLEEVAAPALPQLEIAPEQAPIKSAELKAPKGELKQQALVEPRALGFESATAHRNYKPVQPVVHVRQPAPVVRVQPVVRASAPAVNRGYLQRDRYPPSPVQGYRRDHQVVRPVAVVAGNPRVSFYSAPSPGFEDDHSSFDQPEAL